MPALRTPHDFAALLKGRRHELGESQAQFAARIRKSQAWVSDIERGVTPNIYIGTMLEVLSLAGFDLDAVPRGMRHVERPVDDDADLVLDFPDEAGGFSP
ncbi:helix-turn-helix transcriptional regulator [Methylobacterium sp. 092160098-2]|uniref:helix-turn-helix domain-containing protein n=1 Tax=Methylobacterium sp. 092160098-2 TaxID=3025129 RepID=UPI0023819671|nr:helix-turn-helix transcriptional regulator [Methylobacterium sp. 092160098-2]MDE4915108.1 helix-turn-helix transcriptional regulator [Methylobacterium sp. 092160098-2]